MAKCMMFWIIIFLVKRLELSKGGILGSRISDIFVENPDNSDMYTKMDDFEPISEDKCISSIYNFQLGYIEPK